MTFISEIINCFTNEDQLPPQCPRTRGEQCHHSEHRPWAQTGRERTGRACDRALTAAASGTCQHRYQVNYRNQWRQPALIWPTSGRIIRAISCFSFVPECSIDGGLTQCRMREYRTQHATATLEPGRAKPLQGARGSDCDKRVNLAARYVQQVSRLDTGQ